MRSEAQLATKRPKKPKLGETELLMLFNVDIYETEFRHIHELETRPFSWCKEGFILDADDLYDLNKPLSHASLVVRYLKGDWPD